MNENSSYIFDIEEPQHWEFTGEPVWISGWFLSKTGAVFSDVRALIDGIPYMGILGLPRPEIEERYRNRIGLPHAGLLLCVRPPRRSNSISIELLDSGHNWVEIWRQKIKVKRGDNTIGRYQLGLLSENIRQLLQAHRKNPEDDLMALGGQLVQQSASVPLDTLPNPPFFGALERPELIGVTQFGKIRLEGWIIHLEQRICRLIASTHPLIENELDYGNRARPEAAELFPEHPQAGMSQYFGLLDIDESAPGPVLIKLWAELEDGTRHLVFSRRFYPRSCNTWEQPLPVFNRRDFFKCLRIIIAAARERKVRLGKPKAFWKSVKSAYCDFRHDAPRQLPPKESPAGPYHEWQELNSLSPRLKTSLLATSEALSSQGTKIAVLIDARHCTTEQLSSLQASLAEQIYPNWEAWFIGETPVALPDERFHFEKVTDSKRYIHAFNSAADQTTGKLLSVIPGHSRLSKDAFIEIANRYSQDDTIELIYTDEDQMDDDGNRSSPVFKPEWSPTLALSGLYPGSLTVIKRSRFVEVGCFREGYDQVIWYDLLLRISDHLDSSQVLHVPLICHHARASIPKQRDLSDPLYEQSRKALAETLLRRGLKAEAFLPETGHHRRLPMHQPEWHSDSGSARRVTIVIPTRDRLHLLQECVELLEETVDWRTTDLVIVDDHSRDADAVAYLAKIQKRTDLRCTVVRLSDPYAPFNYSRLVNAALPYIETPLILHLNNDVNALAPGWIDEMSGWFAMPDVGIVGAKLIYPDRSLNHTGIIIGPHGGLADTPFAKIQEQEVDVTWHSVAREVSAVTGACLMTRTELYQKLGGFDETDFGVAYNDTDYCLRVRAEGFRVIYTPQAKLMHWGSASRGVTFNEAEHIAWLRRYPNYADPYCSAHLQLQEDGLLHCRSNNHARADRAGKLRLLLLTHNLNLEGAPLFLLEYATYMRREAGFQIEVLASDDGPLREAFESLGATITLIDTEPLYASPDEEVFNSRLTDISHEIEWDTVDLVVCNTLVSFWGVLLAQSAEKPSLFYIHESTSVFRFFDTKLSHALHFLVHEGLGGATRTLFLCNATRRYYEDDNYRGHFRIVPSWIHLDEIASYVSAHPRKQSRAKLGIAEDEIIIANIGTVCERKGQHTFIRAVQLFNQQHPEFKERVRFLLVGAREGVYLDLLKRDIAQLNLTNISLVPETRDVFAYFVATDMFVCTSFEESFPRVVMEAMAFHTPIVTTDVHGIPEMVHQRQEAYLVKPGDAKGLAQMMHTCLAKEQSGKSLTATAYSRALRYYDYAKVLPYHVKLAQEAWLTYQ